ncbi:TRAP transporter small permease [Neoaquamicrobium sediminum]|uniref:TRAP transporter small permease n=1 Tax=Neoaquamicrobium sediminum TaxID=1849104 RepID=UPI003BAC1ECD
MPIWLTRATAVLTRLNEWTVIAMMAVMVGVVAAEVAMRYLFASSLIFGNELSRLLFVWIVFLGLPLSIASGKEVSIRLLPDLVGGRRRAGFVLAAVIAGLGIMLMLVVAVVNWEFVASNWHRPLNTLPGNAGLFHLPITLGAVLTVYHLLVALLRHHLEGPTAARGPDLEDGEATA